MKTITAPNAMVKTVSPNGAVSKSLAKNGFTLEGYPPLLTAKEAQKVLRVSRNQIYNLMAEGTVPSIKLGKRVLVPRAALESMLNGHADGQNGAVQ